MDLICSANTLSRIYNLDKVVRSITHVLSDEGILIIAEPSLLECLKRIAYDQCYNEHSEGYSHSLAINNLPSKNIILKPLI